MYSMGDEFINIESYLFVVMMSVIFLNSMLMAQLFII
mgnify:CR=1 FL=1